MVNFRYHVASLVAVFLALAVGVVLGAGPLQNTINAASEGTNVAERAEQLEKDLIAAQMNADEQDQYIREVSAEFLPGTLDDTKVALIALPGATEEDTQQVADAMELAGASVVGTAELTDNWVATTQREYRDTLATPVSSHLKDQSQSSADAILGQALVEVLTLSGSEVELVREILSDQEVPLVAADSWPTDTADALVLVGPSHTETVSNDEANGASSDEQSGAADSLVSQNLAALAEAASGAPAGAVAVGSAATDADVIAALRSQSVPIATVDQAGTAMANLNAALALTSGQTGAYGQQLGAETAVAPLPSS